jgi:hypothetical protein
VGKVTLVARIKLGSRVVVIPIYVFSGVLMYVAVATQGIAVGLLGILVFMVGALIQLLGKAERNRVCLLEKIDQSVGKVWVAGERAGDRRRDLEAAAQGLAVVRDLAPRR